MNSDTNEASRIPNDQPSTATQAPSSLSRRSFFGRVSASTAVAAATGVGLPSFLLGEKAKADDGDADADDPSARKERSYQIRKSAALEERKLRTPPQISNGDETRYPNFIGNYSQGLPHDLSLIHI